MSALPSTLKRLLFRLHWLLGLSVGLVLAVVGSTGAVLSYQAELLDLLNPQYRREAPDRPRLPLDRLVRAAQAVHPRLTVLGLAGVIDSPAPLEVRLGQFGQRGGVQVRVDPYMGVVLGEPHGAGFFHCVEELHRFLAAGAVGKQIVGASVAALLLLVLSGLVLRWPRRWRSPRPWLRVDLRLRGRPLLWQLHAVLGTWLLPLYLIAALTGLSWSYELYRAALNSLAGVAVSPARPEIAAAAAVPAATPRLDAAFAGFLAEAPGARRFLLQLPASAEAPLEWRYLTAASAHSRAFDSLRTDRTGRVLQRQAYADLPRGRRLLAAIFPLHSGEYWGPLGRVLMTLAALLLPLFAVTGGLMWLQRRARARRPLLRPGRPIAVPTSA